MHLKNLLGLFDLRDSEADLYQILLSHGMLGASELARQAGVSRTSVYDVLERLTSAGLVTETSQGGIKKFVVQPPEKIQLLLTEKEARLAEAKKTVHELGQLYSHKQKTQKPRLQLFESKEEVRQMMKDLLLYRDIEALAFWPVKRMLELLGTDFMAAFHRERAARNITLRVIWPAGQVLALAHHPYLAANAEQKRQIRVAPKAVDYSLGYSIYSNTVRFISSSKETFGFLVDSAELSGMMRSQFEMMWQVAKPLKQPGSTRA